jgi:integrase
MLLWLVVGERGRRINGSGDSLFKVLEANVYMRHDLLLACRARTNRRNAIASNSKDNEQPPSPVYRRRAAGRVHSYRPTDTYCESLFVSVRRGRSGGYESLTKSGVLYCVRDAARRAGIEKRVYTHLLRHSFFTHGLRGGMNTLLLAQIGGHSSLRMLQDVYSHLDMDDA